MVTAVTPIPGIQVQRAEVQGTAVYGGASAFTAMFLQETLAKPAPYHDTRRDPAEDDLPSRRNGYRDDPSDRAAPNESVQPDGVGFVIPPVSQPKAADPRQSSADPTTDLPAGPAEARKEHPTPSSGSPTSQAAPMAQPGTTGTGDAAPTGFGLDGRSVDPASETIPLADALALAADSESASAATDAHPRAALGPPAAGGAVALLAQADGSAIAEGEVALLPPQAFGDAPNSEPMQIGSASHTALAMQDDATRTGMSDQTAIGPSVAVALQSVLPPRGMPTYWAAREAAERSGADTTDGTAPVVVTAPAPVPAAPSAPQVAATAAVMLQSSVNGAVVAATDDLLHDSSSSASVPFGTATAPASGHPSASPAAAPLAMPRALPAQIAAALAARTERPIELRMITEELGGLHLSLQQDGDQIRVALNVERGDTLDLLRRNSDLLIQELRAAGFAGATLSFAEGSDRQDRPTPQSASSASAEPRTDPSPPSASPPAAATTAAGGGGLDLRY